MDQESVRNWQDFTRSNYLRLLKLAARDYTMGPVADWENGQLTALWRHDVDCSPQAALALARIEQQENVRATYYFNLRSDFYNLFEPAVLSIVRAIHDMGHEVGIHLDADQVDVSCVSSLTDALSKEKEVFRSILDIQPQSFSFHNPSAKTTGFKDRAYAGLINAYSAGLFARFAYCSDSNGYWRYTPLETFLGERHPGICVLTHPEWWQEQPLSPRARIVRSIEGRAAATLSRYDDLLEKNGRKNLRT